MNAIFAELLTLAKKVELYELDSSTWDSTTEHKWIVPAGKRWALYGGSASRDVSATCVIRAYNVSDKHIITLQSASAGTTLLGYPIEAYLPKSGIPLFLDPGEYVLFTFGVAQSTAAWIAGWALEVDI